MKKALLIVDLQNDFCPGGALAVPDGDQVVPVINRLIPYFEIVIASKDWHPPKTVHFEKWPPHCVRDTLGAQFHPNLNDEGIHKIFLKGTSNIDDGYSAFEATNENLASFLRKNQINHLYVTGLATDYCVRASALDAAKLNFETFVIRDAVKGVELNPGDSEKALYEMKTKNIRLIASAELLG